MASDEAHDRPTVNDMVVDAAESADLRLARLVYCDLSGLLRGKATHAAGLTDRLIEGIGLSRAHLSLDGLDRVQPAAGLEPVGEVRLVPDPRTFTILPYAPRTALMFCDMLTLDRRPWDLCPRTTLRRVLELAEDHGLSVEAGFETEYYLGDYRTDDGAPSVVPAEQAPGYSVQAMQALARVNDDLLGALEQQDVSVEQIQPEVGPGQFELSVRHGPAMRSADTYLLVKETIRAVAGEHGRLATFAPVPFTDQPGSGAHIHLSLWDTHSGENRFYDPRGERGFSEDGQRFIAGILAHLPGLLALLAPTVNSYRRLRAGAWAGAIAGWGFDNRETAVRVPSTFWGREQGTTNIEVRSVDNTCNPYLALAGIVAAGLQGLEDELEVVPPIAVDPSTLSSVERERHGVIQLPNSLGEALDALEADRVLTDALGPALMTAYLAVRRAEVAYYRAHSADVEFRDHALRY
ncbi:MAG TPA: glutamine synthetase family protein [Thermomicrobiales bacterium]|jgi:glutamine synthetase|nr:glutamine synthetase family protein [Thermomicrobiales bacterium]